MTKSTNNSDDILGKFLAGAAGLGVKLNDEQKTTIRNAIDGICSDAYQENQRQLIQEVAHTASTGNIPASSVKFMKLVYETIIAMNQQSINDNPTLKKAAEAKVEDVVKQAQEYTSPKKPSGPR